MASNQGNSKTPTPQQPPQQHKGRYENFEKWAEKELERDRYDRRSVERDKLLTARKLESTVKKYTSKGVPDSTQVLTLAYGNAGQEVTYTLAELKDFLKIRERTFQRITGRRESDSVGILYATLMRNCDKGDIARSHEVSSAAYYQKKGNIFYFQVSGNAKPHYRVAIRLESWNAFVMKNSPTIAIAIEQILSRRISFECPCARHRYWYRYLASLGGYAISPIEKDFPKIRNPRLKGCACKHVIKVLRELHSAKMRFVLGRELQSDRSKEGYGDRPKKTIRNEAILNLTTNYGRLSARQAQKVLKEYNSAAAKLKATVKPKPKNAVITQEQRANIVKWLKYSSMDETVKEMHDITNIESLVDYVYRAASKKYPEVKFTKKDVEEIAKQENVTV